MSEQGGLYFLTEKKSFITFVRLLHYTFRPIRMETLSLDGIRQTFPKAHILSQGDNFMIMDLVYPAGKGVTMTFPRRVDGIVCIYCVAGDFDMSIGMDDYHVRVDNFTITLPGDIVRFAREDLSQSAMLRIMALSDNLLQEMEFDFNKAQIVFEHRMIKASLQYKVLIHHFRNLFRSIILASHDESVKSLGYMLRSMNIEINHLWETMVDNPASKQETGGYALTGEFVSLVSKHHAERRDLGFYASKMSLTPKYLSAAVKRESGRTAVEWISSYVIREAKYYLRNTGLPIKKIAWDLNFKNQMDFYRYFRRHVGMSPKEYRLGGTAAAAAGRDDSSLSR